MNKKIPRPPELQCDVLENVVTRRHGFFFLREYATPNELEFFHTLNDALKECCTFAEDTLYCQGNHTLKYCIVNQLSPGAFCASAKDINNKNIDLVGLNIGTIIQLCSFICGMLCHDKTFLGIGDPAIEATKEILIPVLGKVTTNNFLGNTPKCNIRRIYALILNRLAVQFILFHEIGHLRNGHVELKHKECFRGRKYKQALEMDADSQAIRHTLNEAFAIHNFVVSISPVLWKLVEIPDYVKEAFLLAFGDYKKTIRTVTTAMYCAFRPCANKFWSFDDVYNGEYPPFAVRQHMMIC